MNLTSDELGVLDDFCRRLQLRREEDVASLYDDDYLVELLCVLGRLQADIRGRRIDTTVESTEKGETVLELTEGQAIEIDGQTYWVVGRDGDRLVALTRDQYTDKGANRIIWIKVPEVQKPAWGGGRAISEEDHASLLKESLARYTGIWRRLAGRQ